MGFQEHVSSREVEERSITSIPATVGAVASQIRSLFISKRCILASELVLIPNCFYLLLGPDCILFDSTRTWTAGQDKKKLEISMQHYDL